MRKRRGITPIIAIIILLLITVALGGTAWTYMSGMVDIYTQNSIEISQSNAFCNNNVVNVLVRNMGTAPVQLTTTPVPFQEYAPDDNTVLLYHFNENAGTSTVDSSTSGNDGILEGTTLPAWSPGVFGSSLRFPGHPTQSDVRNGSFADGATNVPSGDNPITYEAWVFLYEYQTDIISIPGATVVGYDYFQPTALTIENDKLLFVTYDGGLNLINYSHSRPLELEKWYHVAGSYVPGATPVVRLYVNGEMEEFTAINIPIAPNYHIVSVGSLLATGSPVYTINATIDEVRISNITRTFSGSEFVAACDYLGSAFDCGGLKIERVKGTHVYPFPYLDSNVLDTGDSVRIRDNCQGKCEYVVTSGGVAKEINLDCF